MANNKHKIDFDYYDKVIKEESEKAMNSIPNYVLDRYKAESKVEKLCKLYKSAFLKYFEGCVLTRIKGNPDNFLITACLCKTLLELKPIYYKLEENMPGDLYIINYTIIANVALRLIQNSFVYDQDNKIDLDEIEIDLSEELIPNNSLKKQLIVIMCNNEYFKGNIDELYLAYIFELIFLYSKQKKDIQNLTLNI